jgi:hypothetical protein
VPLIGAYSFVFASAVSALLTFASALYTDASAEARLAADVVVAFVLVGDAPLDPEPLGVVAVVGLGVVDGVVAGVVPGEVLPVLGLDPFDFLPFPFVFGLVGLVLFGVVEAGVDEVVVVEEGWFVVYDTYSALPELFSRLVLLEEELLWRVLN